MHSLKKVAFYINSIGGGGAERVMVNLAKQFAGNGVETVLITSFIATWEYPVPDGVKRIVLDTKEYKSKISKNISRIRNLRRVLKQEKPDCLISFMAEPNYRALIATMGLNIKTIISVRNDPKKEYAGKLGAFLAKVLLPRADGCVFQTEDARAWFVKKLQKKSVIIPNAVANKFYGLEWMPIHGNIVTVGRLAEQKNHRLLISAFQRLHNEHPETTLSIYGSGKMESELREYIVQNGMENSVFLKGPSDDVPEVLRQANMFVLSSDYEGMPNALMEALAVGVPSVSTACPCGGPAMLIENEKNGYLVPCRDVIKMYQAMKSLYENLELQRIFHMDAAEKSLLFQENEIFLKWLRYVEQVVT